MIIKFEFTVIEGGVYDDFYQASQGFPSLIILQCYICGATSKRYITKWIKRCGGGGMKKTQSNSQSPQKSWTLSQKPTNSLSTTNPIPGPWMSGKRFVDTEIVQFLYCEWEKKKKQWMTEMLLCSKDVRHFCGLRANRQTWASWLLITALITDLLRHVLHS